MPKARRRKDTQFETSVIKSVSFYGQPNKSKSERLKYIQAEYVRLVNHYIGYLENRQEFFVDIMKNRSTSPEMRAFEKMVRPSGVNSAFSQNAFDEAVCKLSNRMNDIRSDMIGEYKSVFTISKVLFAMAAAGKTKRSMCNVMSLVARKTKSDFHKEAAITVCNMSDAEFMEHMKHFHDLYATSCVFYGVPSIKTASVPLDSRLHKLEISTKTTFTHVIYISDPFQKGRRIAVPVSTSGNSIRRMDQYDPAGSVSYTIRDDGSIRVMRAVKKTVAQPATSNMCGVDTGITDCFHTSDGIAIQSFDPVVSYYKDVVEPSLGGRSDLRNKKLKIMHFLHTHKDLPKNVRRSLILKIDRLEQMLREENAHKHNLSSYYGMLDHVIADAVRSYIDSIDRDTLTVLEKLDIKEFNKSRQENGKLSVFARGKLQKRLMEQLNWHGYDFVECVPDYTSQTCPVCGNLNKANRNGKSFHCTCCGHEDDADHVGAINIKARAIDSDVISLCEKYKYSHKQLQGALRALFKVRNDAWKKNNTQTQKKAA